MTEEKTHTMKEADCLCKECVEKNIEMEIKEAILRAKISFDDLKEREN